MCGGDGVLLVCWEDGATAGMGIKGNEAVCEEAPSGDSCPGGRNQTLVRCDDVVADGEELGSDGGKDSENDAGEAGDVGEAQKAWNEGAKPERAAGYRSAVPSIVLPLTGVLALFAV